MGLTEKLTGCEQSLLVENKKRGIRLHFLKSSPDLDQQTLSQLSDAELFTLAMHNRADESGKGIVCTEPLDETTGLYASEKEERELLLAECAPYMTPEELEMVSNAQDIMDIAHKNQYRYSGDPYSCHPRWLARQLVKRYKMDGETIAAALLHDVVEDQEDKVDNTYIADAISPKVAHMVDALTKVGKGREADEQMHLKILLESLDDPRIALIKFMDRIHYMRTIGSMKEKSRRTNIRDTRAYFIPHAIMFGMHDIAAELETHCIRHTSDRHAKLVDQIESLIEQKYTPEYLENVHRQFDILRERIPYETDMRVITHVPTAADVYWHLGQEKLEVDESDLVLPV